MTIIDDYLEYQEKYSKIYGNKAVVFMQVGSFHEAYSTASEGFNLKELEPVLNLKFTRRDNNTTKVACRKNPHLLGFPSISLNKYLTILTENGYTVVVFDQVSKNDGTFDRSLVGVFSPGTHLTDRLASEANNMLSVYICEEKQIDASILYAIGLTIVDVTTGNSTVHEFYSRKNDEKFGLDELVRIIKSTKPKEMIIYYHPRELNLENVKELKLYLELDESVTKFYTYYDNKGDDQIGLLDKDTFKLNNQNSYLAKIFDFNNQAGLSKKQSSLEILDIEMRPYVVISLIIILKYISEHNINLLKNLSYPDIYVFNRHLLLGNNAVQQLNILDANCLESYDKRTESLLDVINKTATPMGKRLLKENLVNPLSAEEKKKINKRYSMIDELIYDKLYIKVNAELKNIHDMARLHRKMALGIITPWEFSKLDMFYQATNKIFGFIRESKTLKDLILKSEIKTFMSYQEEYKKEFNVAQLFKYTNFNDIENSFFNPGYHVKIDDVQNKIDSVSGILDATLSYFTSLIAKGVKSNSKKDNSQLLTLEYNDREGYYFNITKIREDVLKKNLPDKFTIESGSEEYKIKKSDVTFKQLAKGKTKIFIESLFEHTQNLTKYRNKLNKLLKNTFIESITDYYNRFRIILNKVTNIIAEIDFYTSGAIVADKYSYCRPTIKSEESNVSSYIRVKKLRHPIIERINKEVEYIPHNLEIGNYKDQNGILLFGLNSSGKSSLMKSIGLAVILAQIGYYVPAQEFIYEPYMAMYARITGNDNLFKGLSSFALEMTELNAIIKRTESQGDKTLVIGDEVCRGTESISGTALVASTLVHLSKHKTTFVFASHLHELPKIKEVNDLKNLRMFHLRVEFDQEHDCLIFDRNLQSGPGPSIYGLMVAKYLIKDPVFISKAEIIKKRLMMEEASEELPNRLSKYNKNLIVKECAICFYKPTTSSHKELETHHINFQKDCWGDGKIKEKPYLDKNHMSNLVILCRKCHEKVHRKEIIISGYKDTSIGILLDYHKKMM